MRPPPALGMLTSLIFSRSLPSSILYRGPGPFFAPQFHGTTVHDPRTTIHARQESDPSMKSRVLLLILVFAASALSAQTYPARVGYDIVIRNGRVIDPETGLDAIRNVGIQGHTIAAVSTDDLQGKTIIDATGLIVSPGFIDLHEHGQAPEDYRRKAFDGVTSALEMELGAHDIKTWLDQRASRSLINYGATANYDFARAFAFHASVPDDVLVIPTSPATEDPATSAQIDAMEDRLQHELEAGALGIGMGIQYAPGASRDEVLQIFRLAARNRMPVFTHMRSSGPVDPGAVEALQEVLSDAAVSGASLQVVHVNSTCLKVAPECLAMIAGARARGLDITTEAYPYTAGMTQINSAVFNPGWQKMLGISYGQIAIPSTGERLTRERFDQLHADPKPQMVLIYASDDETNDNVIRNPLVMIASDGLPSHPREAGTYCRILARYVRQQQSLTLIDAIRKMSLMPAQRLASATPIGLRKGRIQVGADADIDVFDLATVSDQATYAVPAKTSTGMKYVLVQGVPIIVEGKLQPNVFPGQPITGKDRLPQP
jgi:N-acyl-D-aspartate/D-glutamate deacylase